MITGSGQGSISKTSGRTTTELSYHRGYSSVFPSPEVWYGDTANLYFVQALPGRMTIHANSSYIRGSSLANSLTNTAYGAVGLDLALQSNLVLSANYFAVSQKFNTSLSIVNVHRSTISLGINYYLPSIRHENSR